MVLFSLLLLIAMCAAEQVLFALQPQHVPHALLSCQLLPTLPLNSSAFHVSCTNMSCAGVCWQCAGVPAEHLLSVLSCKLGPLMLLLHIVALRHLQ
jgi:hypothetical protein